MRRPLIPALLLAGLLAPPLFADPPPSHLDALSQRLLDGQLEAVRAELLQLLESSPDHARTTFLLGMTDHRQRRYETAERLFERALALDPREAVVHHFLGWARLHQGNLEGAARAFERHWRLLPGEPDTVFGLGLVAFESGELDLAERRFIEAIGLIQSFEQRDAARWEARRRDLGKCFARLGEVALARGDLERARAAFERGLSIDPGQTTAWHHLSRALRRLGDAERAAIAFERFEQARDARLDARERADTPGRPDDGLPRPSGTAASTPAPDRSLDRPPMPDVPATPDPFHFTDVSRAAGLDFTTTGGADPATTIAEVKGGGLAVLDVDRDGDLDVLVPNGATLDAPDRGPGARLFENLGGLRFRDATERFGLADVRPWAMGAATGDVNGDGWTDVLLPCLGPDRLLLGGPQGFRDATADAGIDRPGWSTAASFGDVDGDGDLDLLVVGYVDLDPDDPPPPSSFRGVPVPAGPRGLPPARDALYLNDGTGVFTDIWGRVGLAAVEPGYGLAAAIIDLDEDGSAELFVGNDSMVNRHLVAAADGRWRDDGLVGGLATSGDGAPRATMGLAIGDLDGDGSADVFTTNFAGEPNTAHVSVGQGFFDDASARLAIAADSRPFLGWGCVLEDLDHDGAAEVLVVNGHVYPGATRETMIADERQVPLLMRRDDRPGPVRYRRVAAGDAPGHEWLDTPARDRTLIAADLDGDGDLDLLVGGLNQPLRLLRNDAARGDWLIVEPGGLPQGCVVTVRQGETTRRRWIVSGAGYCSAGPASAHVGLGPSSPAVDVEVRWMDGRTARRTDVRPNQRIRIEPGP